MKFIVMFLLALLAAAGIYITWLQHRLDVAFKMLARKNHEIEPVARLSRSIQSEGSASILPAADLLDAVVIEPDRVMFVVAKGGNLVERARRKQMKKLVDEGAVVWIDETEQR